MESEDWPCDVTPPLFNYEMERGWLCQQQNQRKRRMNAWLRAESCLRKELDDTLTHSQSSRTRNKRKRKKNSQ